MSEKKKDSKSKEEKDSNPENNIENLEYSKKIGDYILFDQIGMGTFSKVTRAFHLITEQTVAVKILDKEKIEDEIDIERIIREIEILKNIHHPNIAQMYETYSTVHNFYLMIEYVSGGDLFDYITSHNFLSEKKSCYFFRQIISVLEYLIELGISHRDIKPENILLTESHTQIKFIDFGLSNYCNQNELLHSSCGSPCYASPEMLSGKAYRGTTTDLWSAGIVLYSMLVGALPFDDQELHKLYEQIKVGKFYIPSTLSLEAIDLLKKILEVDPKKRINIEGVKNHPWFKMEENPLYKGINISVEHFPCDTKIASYVIKNYFKEDKDITLSMFVKMIHTHECNRYTATYYLVKNNVLGVEEKFKIRKDKKSKNKETKEDNNEKNNNKKKDDDKNNEKKINNEDDKNKEDETNLFLEGIIKKKDEINTRNKKNEIIDLKNNLGNSQKNDEVYFTGNIEDENQKLRSKTEEDVNSYFNNNKQKSNKEKKSKKISNVENISAIKEIFLDKKQPNGKEEITIKNTSKNQNITKTDNTKKKSSNKDYKNSNKKNNNESRTGKIVIPMLNIKKPDNGVKLDEKCITDRPVNNLKKNQKPKNSNQNEILNLQLNDKNNLKNFFINKNIENKNINQIVIKNSSKNKMKKNKTNSPKSTNNLNFYVINNIINKDNIKNGGMFVTDKEVQNGKDSNGNEIISLLSKTHERINSNINEKKKVFDKIKINFKTDKDYKYTKSPSDINLIPKNSNNNIDSSYSNNNNQNQLYKTSNNNDFNEGILFSNRIKIKNSSNMANNNYNNNHTYNNSNLFMRASNNTKDKISINNYDIFNNPINNNIFLCDNNISNNVGGISNITNQKNNISINQYNNYNKNNNKKKNLNIFTNYVKQKNVYNIFNNDYSKNQPHQRNFKSALKYQLTEFKTENQGVTNNLFLPKKKTISRNKKSSYNKEYNTNFLSKNKNTNTNIIKEYANKFLINNNQKQANSIDDSKANFSSTPKYIDKISNSKDKKKYFVNHNILNIEYLLKGKNKKNKLILTSTIGNNNNNSPKNIYNIGQNYFGNAFHTEGNVKNNSTNKNRENLSVILKKGIIKNQKKVNKDIFSLRVNKNNKQKNIFNNSKNIHSNINSHIISKSKGF